MRPPLPPLNALRAFEAAARHRHMGHAARELGVTHGAVSRQVRLLEEHLGRRLFLRTGRGLALTDAGEELAAQAGRLFGDLARAVDRVAAQPTPALLRVGAPRAFTNRWLAPRLGGFCEAHPWLEVRMEGSFDEQELGRGEADVSVRFGDGQWAGLHVEGLGEEVLFPVCAPSLLHGPRALKRVEDLARHTLLHDAEGEEWALWLTAVGAPAEVDPRRGPRLSELTAALAAAEAAQGVAIGRPSLVGRELARGRLVRPFPGEARDGLGYHLLATPRALRQQKVAAFRSWLLRELAASRAAP
jgi:LysR family glycine cleavage system transcriptional activator